MNITTPQELGKALKKYFKERYGLSIETRYIKTVRGLMGSWYEISTYKSGATIPNEIRLQALNIISPDAKPLNPDCINYGTILSQRIAIHGRHWIEFLEKNIQ